MMLLNIQFWEGDKIQAMQLARLIADLEPRFREDVAVLFTARFDCTHDHGTIQHVSQKFRTFRFTTRKRATGWPDGPNQMMGDSYMWVVEAMRDKKMPDNIECILFVEADCVPLSKDWINMLYREWRDSGKAISGAWLKHGDAGIEHINGNCIMSIDFWKHNKAIFHPPSKGGWDAVFARSILPVGHPSALIWSDYQLGQAHNPWRGCDFLWAPKRYNSPHNKLFGQDLHPVWFHGIKTLEGIKCVRQRLLDEP